MKSLLILLMFSFTSNVILSSPCESESCAYNGLPAEFNPIIPEEAVILIARCYVGCCENKLVNLTAGIFKLSSTTLEWPSAFVDFTSNSKAQACVGGCYRLAANTPTKAACHDSCRLVQGENFDAGTCQQGCDVYYDLQMAANHSQSKKPVPPVRPPQVLIYPFDDAIPSIHLNLADSQTSKSHAPFVAIGDIQSGYLNAFVIRMSYNGFDNFQYLLSSLEDDYINPREEFSCRTVNISFAVVNVYGISDFSPVGTICGEGIAYPKKVNSLAYEFKDDPEGRSDRLVLLTWQHPEDYAYVSKYEIHVSTEISNTSLSHCPDYRKPPRVFHVSRDATSYLLESIRNGSDYSFRIPVECSFIVKVILISLPESTDKTIHSDSRANITFTTCNCPRAPGPPGDRGLPGHAGPPGVQGHPGPKGSEGQPGKMGKRGYTGDKGIKGCLGTQGKKGIPGQPGSNGENGLKGLKGDIGQKGKKGKKGPQGRSGMKGEIGEPGKGTKGEIGAPGQGPPGPPGGGVVYTYWGRHNCSSGNNSELVYRGWVGAGEYGGGGSNFICTTDKPAYYNYPYWYTYPFLRFRLNYTTTINQHPYGYNFKGANMSGVEYKSCNWQLRQMRNQNVPCAVCYVPVRSVQIMIPGTYICPSGWTREYYGWLMGPRRYTEYRGTFICIAKNPQGIPGCEDDDNGAQLVPIRANCPTGIKCPPYNDKIEMSCVVCTK